jgi:hypothetical protein
MGLFYCGESGISDRSADRQPQAGGGILRRELIPNQDERRKTKDERRKIFRLKACAIISRPFRALKEPYQNFEI